MKHVLFILLLCFSLGSLKAELLSHKQVQMFMETHGADIDSALSGKGHKAYRTIAVAKNLLEENPFHNQEGNSYYANVILSVLRGIGFGGINAKATASEIDTKAAVGALSLIGFNLENPFTYTDKNREREPKILSHLSTVEAILKQSFECRASLPPSGVKDLEYKILFGDFKDFADRYVFNYCSARDFASSSVRGEKTGTGRYHGGNSGTRAPQKPAPNPTKTAQPKPAPAPASGTVKTEDGLPWNGIFFRSKAAAEKAIERGSGEGKDSFVKATGNLRVMYRGKSTYSSSTATVISCALAKGGAFTFHALTNAHCVTPDAGDVINSISLELPSSETLVINEVYTHPLYNPDTGNAYDVAIVKGSCGYQLPYIPVYYHQIDKTFIGKNGYVVSYGDVNYVDGSRVVSAGRGRALSIKRVTKVGYAPQYKMETPTLLANGGTKIHPMADKGSETYGAYGVVFPPVEKGVSHELDAAYSFGASGSPFFMCIGSIYYLVGILETLSCDSELGVPIRKNCFASTSAYKTFIENLIGGGSDGLYWIKPKP